MEPTSIHKEDSTAIVMRVNGLGSPQLVGPIRSDPEIAKLDEVELKAAIESTWKMFELLAKKKMGQLLYWLREKLKAQGCRNDRLGTKQGFGEWVENSLEISRRTADRWADEYGLANGLIERKPRPTSGQNDQKSPSHEDEVQDKDEVEVQNVAQDVADEEADDFYNRELREHGRLIQINCWVSQEDHIQYEEALKTIKQHFKIANDKEAVLKGVQYAGESLTHGAGKGTIKMDTGNEGKVRDNEAVGDSH